VKKPRKKSKKQSGPKKPPTQPESKSVSTLVATQQPPTVIEKRAAQVSEKSPRWRTALDWGKRIGGFVVGPALAIVALIYAVWGPLWPTAPTFDPGFPSFSSPLDVPFNVANKSAIFPISELTILCGLEEVQFKNPQGGPTILREVGTSRVVTGQTLRPLETRSYVCPLKQAIQIVPAPQIEKATMGFVSTYNSPWHWGGTSKSISDRFTLNATTAPPQWTRGAPLQ
jgi:hypothetical protein